MKRNTFLTIGMLAFSSLFASATIANTNADKAVIETSIAKRNREAKIDSSGGLAFASLRSSSSPIWYGKSQKMKHFNKKRHGKNLRKKHRKQK